MRHLVWHITHGVELGLTEGYATAHIGKVLNHIPTIYQDYIHPHATNWSRLVEERQKRTWDMESDLARPNLRKAAVEIACDLLWYRSSKGRADGMDVYAQIHNLLETELTILLSKWGETSLIVREGHSLGSQIMLDACFESRYHTTGLLTLGSPITKYSGMFPDWGHLPDRELSFWTNFYARRDLVSSSFRNHPSEQIKQKVEDVRATSWNPIDWIALKAHTFYWSNDAVCKTIADRLVNHLVKNP